MSKNDDNEMRLNWMSVSHGNFTMHHVEFYIILSFFLNSFCSATNAYDYLGLGSIHQHWPYTYWIIAADGKCWVVKPKLNDCTWAQKDSSLSLSSSSLSLVFVPFMIAILLIDCSKCIQLIWVLFWLHSNLRPSLYLFSVF